MREVPIIQRIKRSQFYTGTEKEQNPELKEYRNILRKERKKNEGSWVIMKVSATPRQGSVSTSVPVSLAASSR
jgi:DNA-binding transcriptional regulator PaaX